MLLPALSRPARSRPVVRAALAAALAAVLAGCGAGEPSEAAMVGDSEIPVSELENQFDTLAATPQVAQQLEGEGSEQIIDQLEAQILTQLVRSEILSIAAEERGIEVTQQEIADERAEVEEELGGAEALEQQLETAGLTSEGFEEILRDRVISEKIGEELVDGEVTDAEVQEFYESNSEQYGEQVSARHILVETEEAAQQAIERIESGEDFATVAEEVSTDTASAQSGGDLGQIARGATVPAFEEAAFGAEVGELVGPVETDFGYHVIEVTDRQPAPELSEVEEEIRTQLTQQQATAAFDEWITGFVSDLEIEVNPRFGTWDSQSLAVVPEADPLGTPAPGASDPAVISPEGADEAPAPAASE